MREKYESLSLVVLKDLAKARGLKGISTMKKGELIDRMLQEDEREKEAAPKAKTVYTARTASGQEGRKHTPKPRREEQKVSKIFEMWINNSEKIISAKEIPNAEKVYFETNEKFIKVLDLLVERGYRIG